MAHKWYSLLLLGFVLVLLFLINRYETQLVLSSKQVNSFEHERKCIPPFVYNYSFDSTCISPSFSIYCKEETLRANACEYTVKYCTNICVGLKNIQ